MIHLNNPNVFSSIISLFNNMAQYSIQSNYQPAVEAVNEYYQIVDHRNYDARGQVTITVICDPSGKHEATL